MSLLSTPPLLLLLLLSSLIVSLLPSATCFSTQFQVEENRDAGELIASLEITDGSLDRGGECEMYINISADGELRTVTMLDREEVLQSGGNDIIECSLTYTDETGSAALQSLKIEVLDENDNVPRFSELDAVHYLNISENFNIPNPVLRLQTVDGDKDENGTVVFSITSGNEDKFFYIGPPLDYEGDDPNRLELFFNKTVDYETYKYFNLTITLRDQGSPQPLMFLQLININIINVNDAIPVFTITQFYFEVPENHLLGPEHPFGNVSALDPDSGSGRIVYSLSSATPLPDNAFQYVGLNNETGEIYLKQAIDFDQDFSLNRIEFEIQVQETGHNEIDVARVLLTIINVNDLAPVIRLFNTPEVRTIVENTLEYFFVYFRIDDADGISNDTLLVVEPPLYDSINNISGTFFSIQFNRTFDREQVDNITVSIAVVDKGTPPLSASSFVTIIILDENDNAPTFSQDAYSEIVGESAPDGKSVITVLATDPDLAENGTVSYAISSVSPSAVKEWFSIDSNTGTITVASNLDYDVTQHVDLLVSASDNSTSPMTKNVTVSITISPAITFEPRSFQRYQHLGIKILDMSMVYFEFHTGQTNGLLLLEEDSHGNILMVEIRDDKVELRETVSQQTTVYVYESLNVSTAEWISVLYHQQQKTLEVWVTGSVGDMDSTRQHLLKNATLTSCDHTDSSNEALYVGGVDLFSTGITNLSSKSDFIGNIRNLLLNSLQVDLGCPAREENTIKGAVYSSQNACGSSELICDGRHFMGCTDYNVESHCVCAGGFSHDSCKEEKNYSPIQLRDSTFLTLQLSEYSLFHDLQKQAALLRTHTEEATPTFPYQLIQFKFRLLKPITNTVLLLYAETPTAVHTFEVEEFVQEQSFFWVYRVLSPQLTSSPVYLNVVTDSLRVGEEQTVTINITTSSITVGINNATRREDFDNNFPFPFVQYPATLISLGGTENRNLKDFSNFSGCISRFSINSIEFPLNGLLETGDRSINVMNGHPSDVGLYCDLCQREPAPCPSSSQCVSEDDSISCECPVGHMLNIDGDDCIPIPPNPTPSVTNPVGNKDDTTSEKVPLYAYIAAAVGFVGVLIVVVVGFVLLVKCKKLKQTKKQTYHVGGEQQLPPLGSVSSQRSRPNSYSNMSPRHSHTESEPGYLTSPHHGRTGSVSTGEHDCDEDVESSNSKNITRSKSSTSGETGFHTASERDERSIPRMDDSGNEKETDYSPFDSESDDTSCVETLPPVGLSLQPRHKPRRPGVAPLTIMTSSMPSAPISSYGAPLTPKEKKFITPLRPDSRSELDEETDLDTDFSSTILSKPCITRAYRGSLKLKSASSPSRTDSAMSGQQWYKASTASDNERERMRAQATRAYYPSCTEPFLLPPSKDLRPPSDYTTSAYSNALQRKPSSPLTPAQAQLLRSKRAPLDNAHLHPPISPVVKVFTYEHSTLPPSLTHSHQKKKQSKKSDIPVDTSAAALSRSQPLKMHYPYNLYRQSSSESPRVPLHLAPRSYIPAYIRSYSEESTKQSGIGAAGGAGKNFVDLGSVRTNCDPIEYWEGQRRMKATVDQVDAYQVLSESLIHFEDSTGDSASMHGAPVEGEEHQSFSSQGGGEATAEAIDLSLLQLREHDTESSVSGTTLKGTEVHVDDDESVLHFPSADCSDEYRHNPSVPKLVASSVGSTLSPLDTASCSAPPSQGTFEV